MTKLKDYINESLLDDEEDLVSRRLPIEPALMNGRMVSKS